LVARLARVPAAEAALDALAREWRGDALVHGDMKWDNCVARGGDGGDVPPELHVVDWELSGVGDSAWDVGSALHSYLCCWLLGLPLGAAASAGALLAANEYPVAAMHPAVRAFWRAYRDGRGLHGAHAAHFLRRSVLFAGARTVQTTWEYARTFTADTRYTHLLLQLAVNVLTRPEQAARVLLGLGGDA
jgi:aminoglycoside phosphotransferase (APT) family kinase protein